MQLKALIYFAALTSFFLAGCGSAPEQNKLEVTCDEFREQPAAVRTLDVDGDSTFTVTLCTSPTTGFLWMEAAEISDGTVVAQTAHEVRSKGLMDASSEEVWTFQAYSSGNSTIHLEYKRPWEIDETQRMWSLDLLVNVRPAP